MIEIDKGYVADYGKEGLSDGAHCASCKAVLIEQQKLPDLTVPSTTPGADSTPTVTSTPVLDGTEPPPVEPTVDPTQPVTSPIDDTKKIKFAKNTVRIKKGKKVFLKVKNAGKKKVVFFVNKIGKKIVKLHKVRKNTVTVKGKKKGVAVVVAKFSLFTRTVQKSKISL